MVSVITLSSIFYFLRLFLLSGMNQVPLLLVMIHPMGVMNSHPRGVMKTELCNDSHPLPLKIRLSMGTMANSITITSDTIMKVKMNKDNSLKKCSKREVRQPFKKMFEGKGISLLMTFNVFLVTKI